MSRSRWLFILSLALIATALWFFWPSSGSSINKTITLPDGSEFTLKAVTYGDPSVFPGDRWRKRLARFLPAPIAARLRRSWPTIGTGRSNLTFWVEHRRKGEGLVLLLMDQEGFGSPTVLNKASSSSSAYGISLEAWACDAFPRRRKTVTLRLYSKAGIRTNASAWGDFVVKNPLYRAYPTWIPEPLPGTRTNEPFEFTLMALTSNQNRERFWESGFPDGSHRVPPAGRALFRVTKDGRPTDELRPVAMEIMDATGNRLDGFFAKATPEGGQFALPYWPGLWPSESAWKLRVEFSAPPSFAAGQLWIIRGLSLYETNVLLHPQCRTNLYGTELQLVSRMMQEGRGAYSVQVTPVRKDYRLTLLRASDNRGRIAAEGLDLRSRGFRMDLPVNFYAESIDLAFVYRPSRFAEFLARPALVASTNSPGFSSPRDSTNKAAQ